MSRRKQAALAVPATDEEAIALIATYGNVERKLRADAELAETYIAKIKAERDTMVAECAPVQRERFAAIKAWWEAGGGKRMAGKNRSAELAGAKIGVRLGNKSVRLPKGTKAEAIVDWLRGLRWSSASRYFHTKYTLNKEAIIAAWGDDATRVQQVFEEKGVIVAQDDEFFIDVGPAEATTRG